MILELKQVFSIPGESLPFQATLSPEADALTDGCVFETPVELQGRAYNRAGVVCLEYTADFTLRLQCDRCLEEFIRPFHNAASYFLVNDANPDSDEYIPVENFKLDMDELCYSDILLNLPSKLLCSRDCQGLCPRCGANLNKTNCLCKKQEIDPRLQALSDLLK